MLSKDARVTETEYLEKGRLIEIVGVMTPLAKAKHQYYLCKQHLNKSVSDAAPLQSEHFESYIGKQRNDYTRNFQTEYIVVRNDRITIMEDMPQVARHVLQRYDD